MKVMNSSGITVVLSLLLILSPAVAADVTHVQIGSDVLQLLSDARVTQNLHTAAARHGLALTEISVKRQGPELAEYRFHLVSKDQSSPQIELGYFTAQAGFNGRFSGIFSVSKLVTGQPPVPQLH